MTDQPSYYSIITANVRYDNRLTDSEKLLFAEITSLSNKYGYCTASNGYFSKLYEVTKRTISARINNLKENGYLKIELDYKGSEVKQRRLYPMTQSSIGIENNFHRGVENNFHTPIERNFQENNTSINNTSNNNINRIDILSGNPTRIPYKEIIDYLNEKTGKKFSHKSKANQKLIQARLNEDNSKEDFFKVIDNMTAQWKGNPKMDEYLRPKTLFSGNFDNYKNQTAKINDESNQYIDAFQRASQSSIENLPF
ncbi:TPA: conserved phage C-terminal domain-containing protein [Staphylococcus aureus]|uniref:conserved phage C-terminal domain-containing protein n=1 Tax=Staphylococcus aureus TaxID=1280 RepID=UPI000913F990|nr:conserved phage C-terminal domain-containing protein [Staphylococcus aureus]SGS24036.1 Conserved phage C-terminus (Phg_2220_C) [Staphylococcus aureus]HCX2151357.1 conserved phage C-terminal domain-containing protein [Staphylococcus aureus]HCX2296012.1 conserved phage C-terminal domain-containing protein [Staphylococcus aureus]HCX2598276.1 conserved phage C-terminal domain-containing protein [Staphylococcus aureus]HCX3540277.1 conserved phage C-terminal domain-containing protein [Staphylococ